MCSVHNIPAPSLLQVSNGYAGCATCFSTVLEPKVVRIVLGNRAGHARGLYLQDS